MKGLRTQYALEMAEHPYALGPPIRTGATWKRVWFDYKCAVKKKLRVNKASLLATGGGPFHQRPLNDVEERVANLTNQRATIEGNSGRSLGITLCTILDNNNNQLLPIDNSEQANNDSEQPNKENEQPNNEPQNPVTARARQKRSRKRQNTESVLRQNEELLHLMKQNIEAQKESTAVLTKVVSALETATAALKEATERIKTN